MGKIIRLKESDLIKIVKKIINEQKTQSIGGEEIKLTNLVKNVLPQNGFTKINPKVTPKYCYEPNMGACSVYENNSTKQQIILGSEGYCYFIKKPQGQTANGPFTYNQCLKILNNS